MSQEEEGSKKERIGSTGEERMMSKCNSVVSFPI